MRGKILQYNGNDGTGIVVVNDQQHKFAIASWKGSAAPAVGKTVEVELADGAVASITLVGDDVLLREKTAELTGKLGGFVSDLTKSAGTSAGASGGGAGNIIEKFGKPVLGSYVVFLIGTTMLNTMVMKMFGQSEGRPMFSMADQLAQAGGGGGMKGLLFLAYASFVVPLVWKDKRAWLALLLPIVAVLWAMYSIQKAMGPMSGLVSYGIGFYVSLAAAAVIGLMGIKKFLVG